MKFNDILSENQVNELGILKNVGSRVKGAVAGYKAKKLQSKGASHAARIVDNLKKEFHQMIGGGMEPTYQSLIDFLADYGLEGLESIPDPTRGQASTAQPPQRIEPTVEDVGVKLSAIQIDTIIKDAVKKNYARIVAAQQGRTVDRAEPAAPEAEPAAPEAEPAAPAVNPAAATPPATPKPPELKAPPVAGNIGAITKAYSILEPKEREELRKQLDIIDYQDRLASGTNESKLGKVRSQFLGIDI
jgi:hypothetical protein